MNYPILYSFRRCPYAMRARMALNLANIRCEIREVSLKNKPQSMIKLSPKATVPVLYVNNKVIDESIEIINWALLKKDIFKNRLSQEQAEYSNEIIRLFDEEFKPSLDRYKYNNRYKNENKEVVDRNAYQCRKNSYLFLEQNFPCVAVKQVPCLV